MFNRSEIMKQAHRETRECIARGLCSYSERNHRFLFPIYLAKAWREAKQRAAGNVAVVNVNAPRIEALRQEAEIINMADRPNFSDHVRLVEIKAELAELAA